MIWICWIFSVFKYAIAVNFHLNRCATYIQYSISKYYSQILISSTKLFITIQSTWTLDKRSSIHCLWFVELKVEMQINNSFWWRIFKDQSSSPKTKQNKSKVKNNRLNILRSTWNHLEIRPKMHSNKNNYKRFSAVCYALCNESNGPNLFIQVIPSECTIFLKQKN